LLDLYALTKCYRQTAPFFVQEILLSHSFGIGREAARIAGAVIFTSDPTCT
jgi:hypothetical protein